MSEEKEKEKRPPANKKLPYLITGSDFRYKGVMYPEGSTVKLTGKEYEAESPKIKLLPVEEEASDGTDV